VVACGGRSVERSTAPLLGEGGDTAAHGAGSDGGGSAGHDRSGGSPGGGRAAIGGAPSSGAGGATPNSGRGGTTGDAGAAAGRPPTRDCGLLIDDMEDGTGHICEGNGRVGVWYAYNDGLGVQIPALTPSGTPILPSVVTGSPSSPGSTRAMYSFHHYPDPSHLSEAWGAGIGLDLAADSTHYGTFAAAGFTGITFSVRSDLSYRLFVRVNTLLTTPAKYGGACPSDYCGTWSVTVSVTTDWTKRSVSFEELGRSFWSPDLHHPLSPPPAFEPNLLTNIQFLFVAYPSDAQDRDIWLDDVAFY